MFLMGTLQLIPDPHCAPLERGDWSDRRSIDIPPRWGEKLNKSTNPKYVFDGDDAADT